MRLNQFNPGKTPDKSKKTKEEGRENKAAAKLEKRAAAKQEKRPAAKLEKRAAAKQEKRAAAKQEKRPAAKQEKRPADKAEARPTDIRARADRNILHVAYFFCALFLCMAGYFFWFVQLKSQDVIGSSYNARLDRFADRIVRGSILSSDGAVLAETKTAADGTETRYYPYDYLFAHSVGYSSMHGKTGVESLANFYLLSSHVNLLEKVFNELRGRKNLGDNVVTTLNLKLQKAASDALGDRRGAVVAVEPDTGKLLVMVSQPNFNANLVDETWEALISPDNTKAQLLNRATQGLYPPGSTFKILTALEYIRENPNTYQDFTFDCTGLFETDGYQIRCYHGEAHGEQTLTRAFANSCNGAFAKIGLSIDPAKLHGLAEQLLFNSSLPLSLPYKKSSFTLNAGSDEWDRLQTSIGQGETQMTPIHNLMITAAIANGGTLMKPYLIDHVENVGGQSVKKFLPSAYGSLMTAKEAGILGDMMKCVVEEGTGSALRTASYTSAGKTGSAEFETGKDTHAWYVGYAPAEDPKIAICVLVEEGGTGGAAAAPIARAVFDAYLGSDAS